MRGLLLAVAFLSMLSPMTASVARAGGDEAIKQRLREFEAAWNKDDAVAMAAVWAEDGTLINPVGTFAQGRDAISKIFVHEHSTMFKATKYETSDEKFQWLGQEMVIVDVTANISGVHAPDGSPAPDYPHHVTWVFVKKDGKWWAAAARPYQFMPEKK